VWVGQATIFTWLWSTARKNKADLGASQKIGLVPTFSDFPVNPEPTAPGHRSPELIPFVNIVHFCGNTVHERRIVTKAAFESNALAINLFTIL
jgi:hypothetical protein